MKITILLFISFLCISIFGQIQTVTIGTQVWMTKNLDVSTFRNGEIIPEAKTEDEWNAAGGNHTPAWCYYNNDPKNGEIYGKLYNCYAVDDSRGLAPAGWHVPTIEEWKLIMYDNSELLCKTIIDSIKKMKMSPVYGPSTIEYEESGGYFDYNWVPCSSCKNWNSEYRKKVACHVCKDERGKNVQGNYIPKTRKKYEARGESRGWNGNNSSGFSALPGGQREDNEATFRGIGERAQWWSASSLEESLAPFYSYFWKLNDENCSSSWDMKMRGFSVRCVKDNEAVANGSAGKNGAGPGNSDGDDGGLGKVNGEIRLRISNVSLPQYDSDYDVTIHLQLTVNANGEVVAAKCIESKTTCTDQLIINQVINEVMKQVKYTKEIGAGLVYTFYTVKIIVN